MRPCLPGERGPRLHAGLVLLALVSARAEAQEEVAQEPAGETGDVPRLVSGFLVTRYRGRFAGGEDDHDLYETVDLELTDPARRWSGSILARASYDLDGRDSGEDALFFGLQDTYDSRFQPQLFHAYFDVASEDLEVLRLGRQPLYETPVTVLVDGARLELAPVGARRFRTGVYAGRGEHPYESSSSGDTVYGAFAALETWSGSELRADWMHLEDLRLGVGHEDDLLGLAWTQDVRGEEDVTRFETRFTSLEGNARDLRVTASRADAADDFTLQASFYRLLKTQYQLAAPLDPFSDTLFELFPYTQVGLSAGKDWEHLGVLAGADVRRVSDHGDEGTFNRDFERWFLTGTLPDALPVSLSLTGEVWRATDSDYETWGASLEREIEEDWKTTLGSYYSLYKYDQLSGEEHDHVRTVYVDLRWRRSTAQRWTLRYELERNDFDDFHTVRVDYTWSF